MDDCMKRWAYWYLVGVGNEIYGYMLRDGCLNDYWEARRMARAAFDDFMRFIRTLLLSYWTLDSYLMRVAIGGYKE